MTNNYKLTSIEKVLKEVLADGNYHDVAEITNTLRAKGLHCGEVFNMKPGIYLRNFYSDICEFQYMYKVPGAAPALVVRLKNATDTSSSDIKEPVGNLNASTDSTEKRAINMSKPLFSIENNNDYIRRNFTDKQYRPVDENEYQSDNVVESLMNDAFLYPDHIENLVKMTGEKWDTFTEEQRAQRTEGLHKYPILRTYLNITYAKLKSEGKIIYQKGSDGKSYAAFNTGLTDELDRDIIMLLAANSVPNKQKWVLDCVGVMGIGSEGKKLTEIIGKMPARADYFSDQNDKNKFFDPNTNIQVNTDHMCDKRHIDRLPFEWLKREFPLFFADCDPSIADCSDKIEKFARAMKLDLELFKQFQQKLEMVISTSAKKTLINYRNAILMYYPRLNQLCFLIPLSFVNSNKADAALVVRRTDSGSYRGETILDMYQSYINCRVIAKIGWEWLSIDEIPAPNGGRVTYPSNNTTEMTEESLRMLINKIADDETLPSLTLDQIQKMVSAITNINKKFEN